MPTFDSKTFIVAALIVIAMIAGTTQLVFWTKNRFSAVEQVKQSIQIPVDKNDVPYIFPLPDDENKKAKKIDIPVTKPKESKGWFDWAKRSDPIEIPAADPPTLPEQKPLTQPKDDKGWFGRITDKLPSLPSLPKFETKPSQPYPDWHYDSGVRTGCQENKDGTVRCSDSP